MSRNSKPSQSLEAVLYVQLFVRYPRKYGFRCLDAGGYRLSVQS